MGKVIRITRAMTKKDHDGPHGGGTAEVAGEIGRCSGCQQHGRLRDGACGRCTSVFGERCGPIMRMVRENPSLRLKCYQALSSERAKAAFVEMFGSPEPI